LKTVLSKSLLHVEAYTQCQEGTWTNVTVTY